jgi:hypothetical protein
VFAKMEHFICIFSSKITKLNRGKHFCPLDKEIFTTSETVKSIESKRGPMGYACCHPIPLILSAPRKIRGI